MSNVASKNLQDKHLPYLRKVACITASGTQWIDTHIHCGGNDMISVTALFKFNNKTTLGCTNANKIFQIATIPNGTGCYCQYNGKTIASTSSIKTDLPITLTVDKGVLLVNGEYRGSVDKVDDEYDVDTYCLFTRRSIYTNLVPETENDTASMYMCSIKKSDKLVLNFIPVLDLSGRPCMYDEVSKQLFYNQGSGEFTFEELK